MVSSFGRALALGAPLLGFASVVGPAAPAAAQPTPTAATADPNVTPYLPAYFAEYRPVTALDMLGRIPGFQFDGGSSARGFAGTAGNVLIDGERPPTRSDSLASVLSRIPAAQVLRIEIVRAGVGGIDMQGKSVVANVIRKPDAGVSGAVSSSLNITDDLRLQPSVNLQAQRQRDGRSLDGSIRLSTGGQDIANVRERRRPDGTLFFLAQSDAAADFTSGETTGVYEGPLGGGRIRANVLINYNSSDYQGLDTLVIPGGEERSNSDSTRWRGEAGLRWTRSLPRGLNLELVGFQSVTDSDNSGRYDTPRFTSDTLTQQLSRESILSGALKFPPRGRWSLETGSEVALNRVDTETGYTFNDSPLRLAGDDTQVEELRTESFVTATWAARANLNFESGLRYETSRITAAGSAGSAETRLSYLKPRLTATWTPRPRETLNFKLEKSVDQLSFGAFTASAAFETGIFGRGNPDIRPGQVWQASARYERLFDRQGSYVAEYTHEWQDDVLGTVVVYEIPLGGSVARPYNITRNVGEASRDKLSLSTRQPLDRFGLTGGLLSAQVTLRWSDTEDPVTFVNRRVGGDQPFGWSLGLSQNLVAKRINWSVSASSGQDQRNYAPSTLSRFRTDPNFNASISYRPDPKLSLSAGLFISGDYGNEFVLFDAPRDRGSPVYTERSQTGGNRQAYFSVRRSF
ncbi:hypothetical protein [uncultured Brevundimonas sp.]|uniref:TonB-dependent receptor plug domain-containing protein n=1 Tax=uncultured Brevundimonas sp. TaxID=213418 RepID=UPI0030EBB69B|tara:strand:- start:34189 stop:36255 length:2067 start_codon:yes stop_codon:yes gene_type:complete